MQFCYESPALLRQLVSGSLGGRPLPILSNVLLIVEDGRLSMTGTDLEVEMIRMKLPWKAHPG